MNRFKQLISNVLLAVMFAGIVYFVTDVAVQNRRTNEAIRRENKAWNSKVLAINKAIVANYHARHMGYVAEDTKFLASLDKKRLTDRDRARLMEDYLEASIIKRAENLVTDMGNLGTGK